MFFTSEHFRGIANPEYCDIISRRANEVLDKEGVVLYGYKNSVGDWIMATGMTGEDTHKCMAFGFRSVGLVSQPTEHRVSLDQKVEAMKIQMDAMFKELKELRGERFR